MGSDSLDHSIKSNAKREVYGLKVSEMKRGVDNDLFPLLRLCVQILDTLSLNVMPELANNLYPLPQHDYVYVSKFKEAFSNILKKEKGTEYSTNHVEVMVPSPQQTPKKCIHITTEGHTSHTVNYRPTPLPPPDLYPLEGSSSATKTHPNIQQHTNTIPNPIVSLPHQQKSPVSHVIDMTPFSQRLEPLDPPLRREINGSPLFPPPSLSSLPSVDSPQQLKILLVRSFCQQTLEKLSTYEMYACARMSLTLNGLGDGADVRNDSPMKADPTFTVDSQDAIKIVQVRLIQLRQLLKIHQEAFQSSKQQHMHMITQQLPLFLSFLSVTLPSEARNIPDQYLNPIYPNQSEQFIHQFLQNRLEQYTEVFLSNWIYSFIEDGKERGKKMALVGGVKYDFQLSFSFLFHLPLQLIRAVFSGLYKSLFYTVSSVHKAGRIYFTPIQFKSDVATCFLSTLLSPQSPFSISLISQLSKVLDSLIEESTVSIQSDIKTLQDAMELFPNNTSTTQNDSSLKVDQDTKLSELMQTIGSSQKILEGILLDLNKLIV
eukprot:TRINITY_DN509_c0_g1_i2.p1 TRINITY_DN509_c0_g1~~TRINITY_DN509_c0_g1_i2.p1  ORF type:complete len:544 (+),score=101.41 TRINITY_DN509_c0_g1_i2:272-1903(+)